MKTCAFMLLGDLSAFDFFRQETSNVDVVIRTEAMSRMVLVCCLMTPDKVRVDFLPYIQSTGLIILPIVLLQFF